MICDECQKDTEYGIISGKEVMNLISQEFESDTHFCVIPSCPVCKKPLRDHTHQE